MLGLRLMTDCQARTKNGQPPQSTTGEARTNSIQVGPLIGIKRASGSPGMNSLIPIANKGRDSIALTQNLRRMSTSSGFSSSVSETARGSKAMPQIGQLPGPSRTICGCIGQVYSILAF